MREIKAIVVHCTDSPDTMDIGLEEINKWHKDRGFTPVEGIYCGYHKIVRRTGVVELAREDRVPGIHVSGHNSSTLGVVWVGTSIPSDRQYFALVKVVVDWLVEYGLDTDDIFGHTEFNNKKSCPNIEMDQFREECAIEINRRLLNA